MLVLLFVVLCGAAGGAAWFATRDIGPAYRDGAYTVTMPGGSRTDRISLDAARRFDAKEKVDLSPQGLARLQLQGLDFTEEEVNSRLAAQLLDSPVDTGVVHVDRVFLELHPRNSIAYAYVSMLGLHITLSSGATFSVVNETGRVRLSSPKAGRLPIDLALRLYLQQSGNTERLQHLLELVLPPQVTAVEPREGMLHVAINVLKQAAAPGYAPSAVTGGAASGSFRAVAGAVGLDAALRPDRARRGDVVRVAACAVSGSGGAVVVDVSSVPADSSAPVAPPG